MVKNPLAFEKCGWAGCKIENKVLETMDEMTFAERCLNEIYSQISMHLIEKDN